MLLLTDKDTFGRGLNWSTGRAILNGNLLLVSTRRLDPRFWTGVPSPGFHKAHVEKVVLHELGHSFGLGQEHRDDAGYAGPCLEHMRRYLRKPGP